jgi:Na+/melibiose symporter-like transporter
MFSGLNAAGDLVNPQQGFPMAAAVIGIIVVAGALFSYFTSKERVLPKEEAEEKLALLQSFKFALKDYNFRWDTAFSTLYFINNALLTTTLVYYCTNVYKNSGALTVVMGIFALGSIVALPAIKKIDTALGRRKAMMLGALLLIISKIPFIIFPYSIITMYFNALVMGLSVALNIVTFSMTRAEVADHIEHVNNRRIDSMVINFMGFINKCGTSLVTLVIGFALQWTGYQAGTNTQPQAVITALIVLIGWASLAVALLMLFCGSKITIEKVMREMKESHA